MLRSVIGSAGSVYLPSRNEDSRLMRSKVSRAQTWQTDTRTDRRVWTHYRAGNQDSRDRFGLHSASSSSL